jgi:hypothetical protein
VAPGRRPTPQTADLIDALARSLQEIAAKTGEAGQPAHAGGTHNRQPPVTDPAEPAEMPQILQAGRERPGETDQGAPRGWSVGQIMAPAVLVLALAVVAGLMFVPSGSVGKVAGAARQTTVVTLAATEREAGALRIEDIILLDRAEAMLLRGEVDAARKLLSEAAGAGNANARFALAETFDPNILAARGMRIPVADAVTARSLYTQALDAGDARARQRLEGLQPGR